MPKATLSTTAPFGFEIEPGRFLAAFAALGCRSCQFFRNREAPPSVAEALRVVAGAGMVFDSVHGVFGPDLDPSSPDASHRKHCLAVYGDEGRMALELAAPMVVVHPSCSATSHDGTQGPALEIGDARRRQQERWPALDDFLARLAGIGHDLGVTYLIENLMQDCPLGFDPVALAEHVLRINSPRLRMCLDTGHAHATLAGRAAAKGGAVAVALRVCAPAVSYIHVHDNDATRDAHLLPGRAGAGGIDWAAFSAALRSTECQSIRMLEVFEDPSLAGPADETAARLRDWLGV